MPNEDKAARYHRLGRRASVAAVSASALSLLIFLVSGGSAAVRAAAERASGGHYYGALVVFVVIVAFGHELIQVPFAYYQGITLERRYGLSTQTIRGWWWDQLKAWSIGTGFGVLAAVVIYSLIRWQPQWWWAIAALVFTAVVVLLAQVAPVLLLPLFYDIKRLNRPALTERLLQLAGRARTPVVGVFEWRLSDRTRKANAALAGIGATRRILLSDTLLAEHSDDEIEVILAHELAHHVHRDIWSAIALESVLIFTGFFLADQLLTRLGTAFGLLGKTDVGNLPLLMLATAGVSVLLMPLANAFSRAHERRADRYALGLTRNADAFVTAMRRLAAQNLAEERPSRVVELLFHSHPSTHSRIAAAEEWKRTCS